MKLSQPPLPIPKHALSLFFTLIFSTANSASAQGTAPDSASQTMTKETFIEAQIEQLKKAEQMQQQLTERNIAVLKKALSAEDFNVMMADEEQAEREEQQRMAQCLGISDQEFKEYRAQFDTQFQIDLVRRCAAALPQTINLSSVDWQSNEDLAKFQACAEAEVAEVTKIPEERLIACSEDEGQVEGDVNFSENEAGLPADDDYAEAEEAQ